MGILTGIFSFILGLAINLLEAATTSMLDLLSFDLATFFSVFPVAEASIAIFRGAAFGFLLLGGTWHLIKWMTSGIIKSEVDNPAVMLIKIAVVAWLVYNAVGPSGTVTANVGSIGGGGILTIITRFFQDILNAMRDLGTGGGFGELAWRVLVSGIMGWGFGGFVVIFKIILIIYLGWQFIKLLLEIVERYIAYCFIIIISPIFIATAAFKSTAQTFATWVRSFFGHSLIIVLNMWTIRMFFSGVNEVLTPAMTLGGDGAPLLLSLFMLIAFLRFAMRIDTFLRVLGLNTAHTGTELGQGLMRGLMTMAAIGKGARIASNTASNLNASTAALNSGVDGSGIPGVGDRNQGGFSPGGSSPGGATPGGGGGGIPGNPGAAGQASGVGGAGGVSNAGGVNIGDPTNNVSGNNVGGSNLNSSVDAKQGGVWNSIKNGVGDSIKKDLAFQKVAGATGAGALYNAYKANNAARANYAANSVNFSERSGVGQTGFRGDQRIRHGEQTLSNLTKAGGVSNTTNGVGLTNRYNSMDQKNAVVNSAILSSNGYQQRAYDTTFGQGGIGRAQQSEMTAKAVSGVASNSEMYQTVDGSFAPVVDLKGEEAAAVMNGTFAMGNENLDNFTTSGTVGADGYEAFTGFSTKDGGTVTWDSCANGVSEGVYSDSSGTSTAFTLVHDNYVQSIESSDNYVQSIESSDGSFDASKSVGSKELSGGSYDVSKSVGRIPDGSGGTGGYHVIPKEAHSVKPTQVPYGRNQTYKQMNATYGGDTGRNFESASSHLKGFIKNVDASSRRNGTSKHMYEQVQKDAKGAIPNKR